MAEEYNNKPFERWLMGATGLQAANVNGMNTMNMVAPLGYYNGKVPEGAFSSIKTKNSYVPEPMDITKVGRYPKGGSLSDTYGSDFIQNNPKVGNIKTDMVPELYDSQGNKAVAQFFKNILGQRSFKFTRNNPLDVVHEVSHSVNDMAGVYDKNLDEGLARFAEDAYGMQDKQKITNKFLDSNYDLPENKLVGKIRNVASTVKNAPKILGRLAGLASIPLSVYNAKEGYSNATAAGANPSIGALSSMSIVPTTQRLPNGEIYNNQTGEKYKEWL